MDDAELETTTKKKGIRPYQNCLVVFCIECVERLLAALSENNDQKGNRRSNNLRSEKKKTLYLEHINLIFTLPLPTSHHPKNSEQRNHPKRKTKKKRKRKAKVAFFTRIFVLLRDRENQSLSLISLHSSNTHQNQSLIQSTIPNGM